ncbi:phosphatase PAP2 family protein [Levilactobacillus enshiensis]|uniref:phosphatase PAP2 family protein n=1 Tax=Levilactobacillus enshiensis TaxID=2590213 RepID=UPI001179F481|nr:phosphatase PAP2 family protein [Levilactobacillus enshiensis]
MTLTERNQQLALGCFGLLGILAILIKVRFEPLMQLDHQWLTAFSSSALGQHVRVWEWLTLAGSPLVTSGLAVVLALFLWRIRQYGWSLATLTAIVTGDGLLLVIKTLVGRMRPLQQVVPDTGFSFPSGHVFSTALLVFIIWTLITQWLGRSWLSGGVVTLTAIVLLGVLFARLGLRDHYPSDVLGSLLLAGGWWLQIVSVLERLTKKQQQKQMQD